MAAEDIRPVSELTFREAMVEAESIANLLESDTLELEDSLAKYARGVELLTELKKRLDSAEQDVSVLMGQLSGQKDDDARDTTLS
ncbi:MAG: exodeoxyribonuclease VII small subunit [Eggerthellaceae bacterium]|nr:exodeoxyribonuclease VII small subunit [Eggerthellaceae bacterium]